MPAVTKHSGESQPYRGEKLQRSITNAGATEVQAREIEIKIGNALATSSAGVATTTIRQQVVQELQAKNAAAENYARARPRTLT